MADASWMDGRKEFAQENCLRVGDFLVFRHLGGFVFDVLVSADGSETGHSEINDQIPGRQLVLSQAQLNGGDVETSCHSESSKQITEIDHRQEQLQSHSESCVLSKQISNLHAQKKCIVEEKVEFKPSKYPYFRSSVKQYSFTWHATLIPTDFARKNNLAKRWCEITIIDQKNRSWPVNLRYRKVGKDQVYLASGWDKLRDAHELKVGDTMVFELIDSGSDPVMKFYKLN